MIQYRQDLPAAKERPSLLSERGTPSFLNVENGKMRLRNALDATKVKRLSLHPSWTEGARLSSDGRFVFLQGSELYLWDTKADTEVNVPSAEALADSSGPAPRWHVTHTTEYVHIKDLDLQTTRIYNLGHIYQSTKAFRLPDGERVLLAGDEHYALWNPDRGKPDWITWCASQLNTSEIRAGEICASPDSSVIALGLRDKSGVFLLDAKTGVILTVINTPTPVSSLAFTPDGTCVMAAFESLGIRVWNAATGGEVMAVSINDGTVVYESRYTPDGKRMLAYCRREGAVPANTIRILDAQDGTLLAELPGECNSFALGNPISPDGARILTEESSTVYLWDISGL
jgi:WD40 repeat protein